MKRNILMKSISLFLASIILIHSFYVSAAELAEMVLSDSFKMDAGMLEQSSQNISLQRAGFLTLMELQNKFPHGKYWNHMGSSVNNPDGYTSIPCTHHGSCSYYGTCGCNSAGAAIQCFGFANKCAYDCYGSYYTSWNTTKSLNNLKSGDVIRYKNDGHSIFVTGVNGDTIIYGDCNSDNHCVINWNKKISKATVAKTLTAVYIAPHELISSELSIPYSAVVGFDSGGYMLHCTVSSSSITSIRVATWTAEYGQDDLKWNDMVIQEDGSWKFYVPFSDHGNEEGYYINHIYVEDTSGRKGFAEVLYIKDDTKPEIVEWKVSGKDQNGYMLHCVAMDNVEVSSVQVATWTMKDGQDDIVWAPMVKQEDGSWKYYVSFDEHNRECGLYYNHIYAYDSAGNGTKKEVNFERLYRIADLGNDFYASIINLGTKKAVTEKERGEGLISCTYTSASNQLWHFMQRTDGSYRIQSLATGDSIHNIGGLGTSGSGVVTYNTYSSNAQYWYLYMEEDGSYYLKPQCSEDCVLDLKGLDSTEGASLQLHTYNSSQAERFGISKCSVKVERIQLDCTKCVLTKKGESRTLVATITPSYAVNKNIVWISSNPNVATVDKFGKVTAVSNGITMVTVTSEDGNHSVTCEVKVDINIPVTGITLDRTEISFQRAGETCQLLAQIIPSNANNKNVKFFSDNTTVANISSTGLVTAINNGTTVVTAKSEDGSYIAKCKIVVVIPQTPVEIESILLNETNLNFTEVRETKKLIASVFPENAKNKKVIWESSNEEVVTVNADGLVTAVANGTASIFVRSEDGKIKAVCYVSVKIPTRVTGILLNQTKISFDEIGNKKQLIAQVQPSNADNKNVLFKSSDEKVAIVTADGQVESIANGSAVITAITEDGNKTAVCQVIVAVKSLHVHSFELVSIKAADCIESGEKVFACKECKDTYTEEIPAAGHSYQIQMIMPTCTENGYTLFTCIICQDTYEENKINKVPHTYYEARYEVASPGKNGSIIQECGVCGDINKIKTIYYPEKVVLSQEVFTYMGKAVKPNVTVIDSNGDVIGSENYTVSYSDNKTVGKANVRIVFQGKYNGIMEKSFTINPPGTSISRLIGKTKFFIVKWKKSNISVNGYEIQYSTNKNFANSKTKMKHVKKASSTSATISRLPKGKNCYVRIRTYKKVSGKKYYSGWSIKKKVKFQK